MVVTINQLIVSALMYANIALMCACVSWMPFADVCESRIEQHLGQPGNKRCAHQISNCCSSSGFFNLMPSALLCILLADVHKTSLLLTNRRPLNPALHMHTVQAHKTNTSLGTCSMSLDLTFQIQHSRYHKL